jgi:hypothetical protein
MPQAGLDPEYEDARLAETLAYHAITGDVWEPGQVFRDYIRSRQRTGPTGFKSPLLPLWWDEWLQAHHETEEPSHVVQTQRNPAECYESIERTPLDRADKNLLIRIQGSLEDRVSTVTPNLSVDFECLRTAPIRVATELATELKLESVDLDLAIHGIRTVGKA